jgi:hypothetical protein
MRIVAGAILALSLAVSLTLAGCATVEPEPTCPPGQEHLRTAQLFFGRNVGAAPSVSEADFRKFMDEEVTPRFPDGLTVMDGGGQWRGAENQLIREASKVVLIVLPRRGAGDRIEAVRNAYKTRFKQDSVLLVTQAACVSF